MPTVSGHRDIGIAADYMFHGGAEAVTDTLAGMFPDATIYASMVDETHLSAYPNVAGARAAGRLRTGAAQALWPVIRRIRALSAYHAYPIAFAAAAFQKVRSHDAVIVTCSAQAKLFRIPLGTGVVVYFHTPTRWLYPGLMSEGDLAAISPFQRRLISLFNKVLGPLDRLGMRRLKAHDPLWLCSSSYVRDQVGRIYGVDCRVIAPPVDIGRFEPRGRAPEDFFLYHGRVTFQKRVDVAIEGCLSARVPLRISGAAEDPRLLRHLGSIVSRAEAQDPSLKGLVTFLGRTSDAELQDLFQRCRALIFPPREDFGLTPIEAISAGVPVVAFGEGGALDYVRPGLNGCFFDRQTGNSLAAVLRSFDDAAFPAETVAGSLPDFSSDRFRREMQAVLDSLPGAA